MTFIAAAAIVWLGLGVLALALCRAAASVGPARRSVPRPSPVARRGDPGCVVAGSRRAVARRG